MRVSDFESEFDPSLLFEVADNPKSHSVLCELVSALPASHRVEQTITNMLTEAVYSYYFAKRATPALESLEVSIHGPLRKAIEFVRFSLVKRAVIGIATTIDTVSGGRTASLPHTLGAVRKDLQTRMAEKPDEEAEAALSLIEHIRETIDATVTSPQTSLKYVNHLRNKWAGHASLDRSVDDWADADISVSLVLLEDALARVVNAVQDLGTLASMSNALQEIRPRVGSAKPCRT